MDIVKDPNTDDILDGKWRTAEDKENHEEEVEEFLEYVTRRCRKRRRNISDI